jgi:trimeric autotransporter adhesin
MRSILFFVFISMMLCFTTSAQEILLLKSSGKVVIGDTSQIMTPGDYNLYVQNGILTERVKVALKSSAEWSDDAFDKTPSLDVVEKSISDNKHLHAMPSVETLLKNGYELKEMDALLLQQIEWLWQHLLTLSKENEAMAKEIEVLQQLLKNKPSEGIQK